MANDPFGLEMSGLPPEMAAQYRGLTREQAIMEAMMKQGMAPGGEAINAGKFIVRRSPLEGVAKVLQAYMGAKGLQGTDAKLAEIGGQVQKNQAQQMADYLQQRNGGTFNRPDMSMAGMTGSLDEQDIPRSPETVTGNPAAADMMGITSTNPRVATLAKILQAQAQKEAEAVKLETGRNSRNQATINAARDRMDVIPASTTATINAARDRMDVVPAGTQATIQALAPLRSAQERFFGTNTAARAAEANYNTGANIPGMPPTVAPAPAQQPSFASPEEKAAYDAVAAAAAKGQVGSAAPGGQFQPSATAPSPLAQAPLDRPLVPGIGGIQSPKARDAAAAAALSRENRPPTATEQKAISDADNAVLANTQVMGYIKQAGDINQKAMGFPGAGTVAKAGGLLPEAIRPKMVDATQTLDNLITSSVLPNLRATFGGNPTEGERQILLDVAGSSSKPPAVRKGIFERAQEAAQARLLLNQQRAEGIRSRQYFTPSGNPSGAPAAAGDSLNYKGYRFPNQEALDKFKAAGG
jgi:hypothetical protein